MSYEENLRSSSGTPGAALGDFADLARYPIDRPESPEYQAVVARCREELADRGCTVLDGFMPAPAAAEMQRVSSGLVPRAYFHESYVNVYSTTDDDSLPEDHPARFFMKRTSAFVPGDEIPETSLLKRLYRSELFMRFIADCVEEERIYEYADPLAGLVINVVRPGAEQPWHFDTNEFIVSTMAQAPEGGGIFEYCPNIRTPESENYDAVGRVLRGEDRSPVHELELRPGDIQIFKGRFALHRVTRVTGSRERLTAILAYAKQPGVIGKVERTNQLFGRVLDIHRQAEKAHRRSDGLID